MIPPSAFPLLAALVFLQQPTHRSIAIDERLAEDAHIAVGDRVVVSSGPRPAVGDTVVVSAIVKRGADPAEISRSEYRIRMHLDQLQDLAAIAVKAADDGQLLATHPVRLERAI